MRFCVLGLMILLAGCSTLPYWGQPSPTAPMIATSPSITNDNSHITQIALTSLATVALATQAEINRQQTLNAIMTQPAPDSTTEFYTQFSCRYPQVRRVVLAQSTRQTVNLVLDGQVTVFENIAGLDFNITPDSYIWIENDDGSINFPVEDRIIGHCLDGGTPDAPLSAQAELVISPLNTKIDCYSGSLNVRSTIGFVVSNLGGVPANNFRVRVESQHYNTRNPLSEDFYEIDILAPQTSVIYRFPDDYLTQLVQSRLILQVDWDNTVLERVEDQNMVSGGIGCIPIT